MDQTKHEYGSLKTITREGRKEGRKDKFMEYSMRTIGQK